MNGRTAGGCGNGNQAKFWTNPQFLISLNDVDQYDEDSKATCVIALMQKDTRLKRVKYKSDDTTEYIQFKLFKVIYNQPNLISLKNNNYLR